MTKFKAIAITLLVSLLFASANKKSSFERELREAIPRQQKTISVIYRSTDGGSTWTPFGNGMPIDATVGSFLVMNNEVFATTDNNGIFLIREGERVWKRIDVDLPKDIDINTLSATDDSFIIGTSNHGIMLSENRGKNWRYPRIQIDDNPVRCLHSKQNILFAGTDKGIYKSLDGGNTWAYAWKGVQVNGFTEINNKIFAALMNGAIMTNDDGANWNYVYKPHTLHDISNDGERIFAMTLGSGLKMSKNDGTTWELVNNGLGTFNLYTFELKRFDNKIFAAQWYGIYTSADLGKSWTLVKNGLPDSTAFTTLEATKNGLIAGIGLRKK
jgi:photosystem II stability/assembly factor-like uncharacterized protein